MTVEELRMKYEASIKDFEDARKACNEAIQAREHAYSDYMSAKTGISEGDIIEYTLNGRAIKGVFTGWSTFYQTFSPFRKDGEVAKQKRLIYDLSDLKLVKKAGEEC